MTKFNIELELFTGHRGYDEDGIQSGLNDIEQVVVETAARQLLAKMGEKFDERLEEILDELVESKLQKLTEDALRARVEQIAEGGFQRTNEWGQPIGDPVTLKERIAKMLSERRRWNGYDSQEETLVEKMTREFIARETSEGLKRELADARDRMRKAVDTEFAAKMVGVMREALKGVGI